MSIIGVRSGLSGGGSRGGGGGGGRRPSRAPLQSQWDDEDLARRIKIVNRAYPALKKRPDLALNLARQELADDDLVSSVTRTRGFSVIQQQAKEIRDLAPDQQQAVWGSYDKTTRTLMRKAGYAGPPDEPGQSILGGIVSGAGDLAGGAVDFVAKGGPTGILVDEVMGKDSAADKIKRGLGKIVARPVGAAATEVLDAAAEGLRRVPHGEDVLDAATDAATVAAGGIRAASEFAEEEVFAPTLGALNTVGRFPSQLYRFLQEMETTPRLGEGNPLEVARQVSGVAAIQEGRGAIGVGARALMGDDDATRHFLDAWERAAVGERYYRQDSIDRANALLDHNPTHLETARQIAGGTSIEEIAEKYGPQGSRRYQDIYLELLGLTGTDRFQRALNTLELGKVSPGRDLVRSFGISLDSNAGEILSGAGDAAFVWYTDPLLVAGKLRQSSKMKDHVLNPEGIKGLAARDLTKLEDQLGPGWRDAPLSRIAGVSPRIAATEEIASLYRNLDNTKAGVLYENFWQRRPRWAGALDGLTKEHDRLKFLNAEIKATELGRPLTAEELTKVPGIEHSEDVWNWYQRQEGLDYLVRGAWQPGAVSAFTLPSLTRKGMISSKVRVNLSKSINFAAQGDITARVPLEPDDVLGGFTPGRNVPDEIEGHTRLWRVQMGPDLHGAPAGVGRPNAHLWYTDSLENARIAGLPLRQFGRLHYVDVPDAELGALDDVTDSISAGAGVRNFMAPGPLNSIELGPVGEFAEVAGRVMPAPFRMLLAPPARLIKLLSARIPEIGAVSLHGPNAPAQFARLLDMEYGGAARGELFDAFVRADNPAVRREMIRSVLDRIFWSNGVYRTEEGRDLGRRYIDGIYQKYAAGDVDMMVKGTNRIPEAILPIGDHADQIAIPDFREVMAQARRVGVLNSVFGGINQSQVDAFMGNYWKPAMLLRVGFAPRAAAEEALATLLRAPEVFTQGAWLKAAKAAGEPVVTYRELTRRSQILAAHIPGEVLENPGLEWTERLAHYIGNAGRGWVRGMAVSRLDPETLHAARLLAKHPALQHPLFDQAARISATRSAFGVEGDAPAGLLDIAINPEGTKFAKLLPAGSRFITYDGTSPFRAAMFVHRADKWMDEPAGRVIAQARQLHLDASDAAHLRGLLEEGGMEVLDGWDAARSVREALAGNIEYRNAYRRYLELRHTDETLAGPREDAFLDMVRSAGNDPVLGAITERVDQIPDNLGFALLTDRQTVLRTLCRPVVELDEVQRDIYGPALAVDPQRYADTVFGELPTLDAGRVRVFGITGNNADEAILNRAIADAFGDLPAEMQPWKLVRSDPNDVKNIVLREAHNADRAVTPGTRSLFYVDVDPDDVIRGVDPITGELVTFLTGRDRGRAIPFAEDIGDQLDDIAAWAKGTDTEQVRLWENLAEAAERGDAGAARELGEIAATRALQHPVNARMQREMSRGQQDSLGNVVGKPLREGMVPVYYPTFRPSEADTVFMALDPTSSTARRFLQGRREMRDIAGQLDAGGHGPQYSGSSWGSTDYNEVRALVDGIESSARSIDNPVHIGIARVDVPEDRARAVIGDVEGVGTHDYQLSFGESMLGNPIDPNAPILNLDGAVANGITYEEALADHARILNQEFDQLFTSNGRVVHELTVRGADHHGVRPEWVLDSRYGVPIPEAVQGPRMYSAQENVLQRISRIGFDNMVTPLVNGVARHPLYYHNALRRVGLAEEALRPVMRNDEVYDAAGAIAKKLKLNTTDDLYLTMKGAPTKLEDVQRLVDDGRMPRGALHLSDDEWETIHKFTKNEDQIQKAVGDAAAQGALNDTIPFIDDHRVRSQFSEQIRNLSPFWWAQEAFFRRWARTLVHSPEGIRKAQLTMQGARHVGFIHTDENGEDVFMIPGSVEAMDVLTRGTGLLFGDRIRVPIPVGITGQVRLATPGFDAIGVPGFGPMVGVPLALVRRHFPEISQFEEGLLGPRGTGRNPFEQFFPAWAVNTVKAVVMKDTDARLASASIMAMQYLEANGHGLSEDPTVAERQEYVDRVTSWARNLLFAQGLFQLVDPAPPRLDFEGDLNPEFRELIQNLPLEEAISVMVERHPDGHPYTVFSTKSASGATLPGTEEAVGFMEANREFIEDYVLASAWMLPQSGERQEDARRAFSLQQELGLRDRKSPDEWYEDFKFSQAADVYFNSRDTYVIERDRLKSSKDRKELDDDFAKWREQYYEQHPMFADTLQSSEGEKRRLATIDEMDRAFRDDRLPDFEHKDALRGMLNSWHTFDREMRKLRGQTGQDATDKRDELRSSFYLWAKGFTADNPETLAFYQRIFDPLLGLDAADRVRLGRD